MKQILLIGAGSAIGGILRYATSLYLTSKANGFPWATLSVNLLGSFCIGLVFALASKSIFSNDVRLFLATGILGGFTTFSAFSYECSQMIKQEQWNFVALYLALSIFGGIGLAILGFATAK